MKPIDYSSLWKGKNMSLKYLVKYPKEVEKEIFQKLGKIDTKIAKKFIPFKLRVFLSLFHLSKYLNFDFKYYKQKEGLIVEFSGKVFGLTPELFKEFIHDILTQYFKNIDERIKVSEVRLK